MISLAKFIVKYFIFLNTKNKCEKKNYLENL
jgi:hypothetical protein